LGPLKMGAEMIGRVKGITTLRSLSTREEWKRSEGREERHYFSKNL